MPRPPALVRLLPGCSGNSLCRGPDTDSLEVCIRGVAACLLLLQSGREQSEWPDGSIPDAGVKLNLGAGRRGERETGDDFSQKIGPNSSGDPSTVQRGSEACPRRQLPREYGLTPGPGF